MVGTQNRPQQQQFYIPGSLESFIPDDHILKLVDRVLDLSGK